MPKRFEQEKKNRIAAVKRHFTVEEEKEALQRFAEALFAHGAAEDIAAYSAERLAEIARAAYAFFRQRESEAPSVRLTDWPEADLQGRAITAVEVLGTNRSFILDSVLGELQASGHRVRLVLHPILEVERDAPGQLAFFGSARRGAKSERPRESFVHVHVALIGDPAEREDLRRRLSSLMEEVRLVNEDWRPMRQRLRQAIRDYRADPPPVSVDLFEESLSFLDWLEEDNFTFLGMRDFSYRNLEDGEALADQGSGLGILRNPEITMLRRGGQAVTMTPEIRAFLTSPEPLIVTKANVKSRVHRRDYMDYVGVKIFAGGKVSGELRILGLFTSTAYTRSVQGIPFIRLKVQRIVNRAGFDPVSHSGKALINILESYPRTELFQADEEALYRSAMSILQLAERPRVRALARRDRFDRFVSILVFVPRDRYSSDVRERIGAALAQMYDGRVSAFFPAFPNGGLARVHFIIGRNPGEGPDPSQVEVEARIRAMVRTWEDDFADALADAFSPELCAALFETYRDAFGTDYRAVFTARDAIEDIRTAEALATGAIAARFFRHPEMEENRIALRFHHLDTPIPLSERVPLLENMGFFVINERTFRVRPAIGPRIHVHEMTLAPRAGAPPDLDASAARLQAAVLAVWNGLAENDGFNTLVLAAGLDWRQAALLRTVGRYLRQAQIPYSLDYLWTVLCRHAGIARSLFDVFAARFDPDIAGRERKEIAATRRLEEALEEVTSLDDDTILRAFLQVIQAAQRTDFYAIDPDGSQSAITLKLNPGELPFLAPPRPFREIFVHSPQVEGVHMRFGPVARGGLRWSDRPQDYRVEVLGLGKAQQVKNAVIVPVGAKGGFVPKMPPEGSPREEVFEAGRQAYIGFVERLLSVTDNLDGDRVVPPQRVVRHDADDPYLVVAADKGTATFSDTANAVSQSRDFWLGDAFASGGSAGYDHKAMGITARGAWEAVKRHFREMDKDIQSEPFSVAGVGDMSGDVFGNGMLLSQQIRLVAAFDHRDIFIDPDPDPAASWAERRRLFDLPRSSWQDYDSALISKGGGVFSRRAKEVPLSPEARKLLGLRKEAPRPNEVVNAILKLPVELMWFGGIGTYVRGSAEPNAEVGDKANDALRITAAELSAKVVGEGANLAMTQRARIEYDLKGGRCNSDAIDNSGGVNSSDLEVNIKIALAPAVRAGSLEVGERNSILKEMTEDVAGLVLRNNYQQTLAISLETARGLDNLAHHGRLMNELETRGLLDRQVEALPDDAMLAEREATREPLTRPEVGVLLASAKIALFDDLVASTVPDDEYLARELLRYFPERMRGQFREDIAAHRLRREIIATQLSNSLINRAGPTVLVRLRDLAGATATAVTRAFAAVRDSLALQELHAEIDALDCRIGGELQLSLYLAVQDVLLDRLGWFVRNVDLSGGIGAVVDHYRQCLAALAEMLPDILPAEMARGLREEERRLKAARVPAELAARMARLPIIAEAADVVLLADRTGRKLSDAARAFYEVAERFRFGRIEAMIHAVETADYYESLALDKARDALANAHRQLSESVLAARRGAPDLKSWEKEFGRQVAATADQLEAILSDGRPTTAKATVAASLVAELASQRMERVA